MPSFSKQAWDQLKALTPDELCRALVRDGWTLDVSVRGRSAVRTYIRPGKKRKIVQTHYHRNKNGYGRKILKKLLDIVDWTEKDLRRLKLIK